MPIFILTDVSLSPKISQTSKDQDIQPKLFTNAAKAAFVFESIVYAIIITLGILVSKGVLAQVGLPYPTAWIATSAALATINLVWIIIRQAHYIVKTLAEHNQSQENRGEEFTDLKKLNNQFSNEHNEIKNNLEEQTSALKTTNNQLSIEHNEIKEDSEEKISILNEIQDKLEKQILALEAKNNILSLVKKNLENEISTLNEEIKSEKNKTKDLNLDKTLLSNRNQTLLQEKIELAVEKDKLNLELNKKLRQAEKERFELKQRIENLEKQLKISHQDEKQRGIKHTELTNNENPEDLSVTLKDCENFLEELKTTKEKDIVEPTDLQKKEPSMKSVRKTSTFDTTPPHSIGSENEFAPPPPPPTNNLNLGSNTNISNNSFNTNSLENTKQNLEDAKQEPPAMDTECRACLLQLAETKAGRSHMVGFLDEFDTHLVTKIESLQKKLNKKDVTNLKTAIQSANDNSLDEEDLSEDDNKAEYSFIATFENGGLDNSNLDSRLNNYFIELSNWVNGAPEDNDKIIRAQLAREKLNSELTKSVREIANNKISENRRLVELKNLESAKKSENEMESRKFKQKAALANLIRWQPYSDGPSYPFIDLDLSTDNKKITMTVQTKIRLVCNLTNKLYAEVYPTIHNLRDTIVSGFNELNNQINDDLTKKIQELENKKKELTDMLMKINNNSIEYKDIFPEKNKQMNSTLSIESTK